MKQLNLAALNQISGGKSSAYNFFMNMTVTEPGYVSNVVGTINANVTNTHNSSINPDINDFTMKVNLTGTINGYTRNIAGTLNGTAIETFSSNAAALSEVINALFK